MESHSINPNRFLRDWIGNSIVILPIAAVVCFVALAPFAIFYGFTLDEVITHPMMGWFMAIALLIVPGMVVGYTVGDRQENLIAHHLRWSLRGWTRWSIIGGLVGGFLVVAKTLFLDSLNSHQFFLMANMPIYVLCLSIAQWQVLRQVAREASLWILGNVVGGIVFSGVLFLNQPDANHSAYIWILLGLWGLATLAQGAITGIIILWLYDRPISEWNDEDAEAVPVYIEIRSRSNRER
ncbi:MAG: hypothetical protein Q9P01_22220 [Anaerolineae bacterium]|nr:hypothetical protein [Anaerolineae bacterium]MDQ7037455.1 hypothetical protein [Anaerolineae bacterium]